MTTQVRSAVFETNSSSSHSLTLGKARLAPLMATEDELRTGKIHVALQEYGWGWERLYTARNKMSYLATQVKGQYDTSSDASFNASIEYGPLQLLKDLVHELTGCKIEFLNSESSYIDHQSVGLGTELFGDPDQLKAFLLDESAYIQTGNDNNEPPLHIYSDKLGNQEWFGEPWRLATTPRGTLCEVRLHRVGHTCTLAITDEGKVLGAFSPEAESLLIELFASPIKQFTYTQVYGRSSYLRQPLNPVKLAMAELRKPFACFGRRDQAPRARFAANIKMDCNPVNVADDDYFERSSSAERSYGFIVTPGLLAKLKELPALDKPKLKMLETYCCYVALKRMESQFNKERLAKAKEKLDKLVARKVTLPMNLKFPE